VNDAASATAINGRFIIDNLLSEVGSIARGTGANGPVLLEVSAALRTPTQMFCKRLDCVPDSAPNST
jgi:hypothetical protein